MRLYRALATVSSMTFLSRILGFVRDMVIARIFGAGMAADVFFVAFKIPNFLRRLFAEGAFAQAFVPVLSETKTKSNHDSVRELISALSGQFALILALITLIGVIAAPIIITVFAPGFLSDQPKFDLAVELLRWTFPYLFFISLTALAGAILNAYGRFWVPAFTPVLLNLSLIGMAVWVAPELDEPVMALAWGVFLAGVVQLAFQLPFLWKYGLLPRPRLRKHEGVDETKRLMIPALFGVSVSQINLLLDTLLASFLVTGSVSWLYYSDRLMEFPLGLLGIALATVVLPSLSTDKASDDPQAFNRTLNWALRVGLVLGVPAMAGLAWLAMPMLMTLFQYGAFTVHDVNMATQSLMAYAFGLWAFILIKVLAPGFYARKDMKTPVRIAIVAMVSNMVMNLILIGPLAHVGLALATSLSAILNAGLLWYGLHRCGALQMDARWNRTVLQITLAVTAMSGLLLWGVESVTVWSDWDAWARVGHLMKWILLAMVTYFFTLWVTGFRLKELMR